MGTQDMPQGLNKNILALMHLNEQDMDVVSEVTMRVTIDSGIEEVDECFEAVRRIVLEEADKIEGKMDELVLIQSNLRELHLHPTKLAVTETLLKAMEDEDPEIMIAYAHMRMESVGDMVKGRFTMDQFIERLRNEYDNFDGKGLCDNDRSIITNIMESVKKLNE